MDNQIHRVTVDRIDYGTAFRFTRLFDCFRIAIHPSRLLMALLLIITVCITGWLMDSIWGGQVVPAPERRAFGSRDVPMGDEFDQYTVMPPAMFDTYVKSYLPTKEELARESYRAPKLNGVFATVLSTEATLFGKLATAAIQFRIGFDQIAPDSPVDDNTVVGVFRKMVLIPGWLWKAHKGYFIVYGLLFAAVWSLLGGAISRSAVVEASRSTPVTAGQAVRFAARRWGWYILAPVIPLAFVGLCWLVLALGSLLLLVPGLDMLAALLFVFALAIGLVMAVMLIGWLAGVHLMYPALSAEASDGFDAMSRAYSYVLARPWRLLLYSLTALVYGAATYLFVGFFLYFTIALTQWGAGTWATSLTNVGDSPAVPYLPAIFPTPKFGQLIYTPDFAHLSATGKVTATLIMVWVYLLIGLLGAYAISFYFSAYSTIYLLLRRFTDGTDPSDVYQEPAEETPAAAKDKIEPTPGVSTASVTPAPPAPAPPIVITPPDAPAEQSPAPPDLEQPDNT
jgi:hypothetical protein